MRENDLIRLRHILQAAQEIRSFVTNKDRAGFESDRMLIFAVLRLLEIVGEAATHVGEETRQMYSQLPWAQIIGIIIN